MVPVTHLWLAILLSSVFVFLASFVVHMVFKWHNRDYRGLPNEDEVRAAIARGNPEPGQYVLPYCLDMNEHKTPEMQLKFKAGPLVQLYLKAGAAPDLGGALAKWFAFNLVLSCCIGYLLSRVLTTDTPCLQVFRVAATISFLVHAGGAFPAAIWMGKPWRIALKEAADGLFYGLVTGAAFGCLWPR